MEQTDRYIWKIEAGDAEDDPNVNGPGWYFVDEAEQFNGPYSSRQEALDSLKSYMEHL